MDHLELYPLNIYITLLFLGSYLLSLAAHTRVLWRFRIPNTAVLVALIGISTGLLLVCSLPVTLIIGLIFINVYRIVGLIRDVQNRLLPEVLRRKSITSEVHFFIITLSMALLGFASAEFSDVSFLLQLLAGFQLLAAVIVFLHLSETLAQSTVTTPTKFRSNIQLPSVTVAIPARNETTSVMECLRSLLQTDYPKLEILVLDDCSQDSTADIIKNFAHEGVRFIEGEIPDKHWLPKNKAYDKLLEESHGEIVIFCGVDVRFDHRSLNIVIETMLNQHLKMASILPVKSNRSHMNTNILQGWRYWRELAVPRFSSNAYPAALSTMWAADKKFLNELGGFKSMKKTIRPERVFARHARKVGAYRFILSKPLVNIESSKVYRAQWLTAVRNRYPELKNRPEHVLLISFATLFFLIGPVVLLSLSIPRQDVTIGVLAVSSLVLHGYSQYLIIKSVSGSYAFMSALFYPLTGFVDLAATNYSMWAYEFSEVIWKGRNICVPVLNSNLKLPKFG